MNQAKELAMTTGINRVSCNEYLTGKTDPFHVSGKINQDLTDCLLSILARSVQPGERMSCQQIADFCGISKQRIHQIERQALKKLRRDDRITRKEFLG